MSVIIKDVAYGLYHVPDFVRYGSKPSRDIADNHDVLLDLQNHLRTYEQCVSYPPHQVFIGNKYPDELNKIPKPWYEHPLADARREGLFGEIMTEEEFYAWLKIADDFDLLWLDPDFVRYIKEKVVSYPFMTESRMNKLGEGQSPEKIKAIVEQGAALPVFYNGEPVGSLRKDHETDDTLKSDVLMENLMAKASGSLAIMKMLERANMTPDDVEFVLDCTETAVGDRYNRGGAASQKPWQRWWDAQMPPAMISVLFAVLLCMP